MGTLVEQAKALHGEIEGARMGASSELLKSIQDLSRRPESWSDEPGAGIRAGTKDADTLAVKDAPGRVRSQRDAPPGGGIR